MKRNTRLAVAGSTIAVALLAVFAALRFVRHEMVTVEPGSEAPAFEASTLDTPPRLRGSDRYKGQVVLLNIWATWCLPCRVEMPSIEALHKTLGPRGLKVVAVSIDDPGTEAQVRDFVKQYGLTFDVLYDPRGNVSKDYQTTGYPETFIIGRDGIIRRKLIGATDWNSPGNRALLENLLSQRAD
jgi:peroxiredoxin